MEISAARIPRIRYLYGMTIGLAAGLLFWQQLILGRILLPVFGSVPTVWLVSLVVFQVLLLGGYALTHAVSGIRHALPVTMLLLAAAAILQHLAMPPLTAVPPSAGSVIAGVLGLSGVSLFLLSMISPALQRLYSTLPQPDARDPYFLYSAGNIGSFAGLLLFPLLLEPLFGVQASQTLWYAAAGLFLVMLAACFFTAQRSSGKEPAPSYESEEQKKIPAERPKIAAWLFYSFVPAALSFGVTSHLINDIAPLPLLSMVPLALYLLTFVLAFSGRHPFSDKLRLLQAFLIAFYIFRLIASGFKPTHVYDILVTLAAFFLAAWRCHDQLAGSRPETKHLTLFYLILATGGALGGIFSVFIAPLLVSLPLEFPLLLVLTVMCDWRQDWARLKMTSLRAFFMLAGITAILTCLAILLQQQAVLISGFMLPALLLVALGLLMFMPSFMALLSIACIGLTLLAVPKDIALQRDFFGVKRVIDKTLDGRTYRTLVHGTTSHGMQQWEPEVTTTPTLYYGEGSGFYDAVMLKQPASLAAIGLGTGNIACVPGKGASIRFFEIDPGVADLARTYFTFLKECPADIVIGDARLELAKETGRYDMMLLDAFSSDAIPVHLLTQEAFALYQSRLKPDGVLVTHISNRFMSLRRVMAGAAETLGWVGAVKKFTPENLNSPVSSSEYAVLSPDPAFIDALMAKDKAWKKLDPTPLRWTDDHIVLIPILHFGLSR
jgi:hypothetical protein